MWTVETNNTATGEWLAGRTVELVVFGDEVGGDRRCRVDRPAHSGASPYPLT